MTVRVRGQTNEVVHLQIICRNDTVTRNDLYCVGWDVKPYSLTVTGTCYSTNEDVVPVLTRDAAVRRAMHMQHWLISNFSWKSTFTLQSVVCLQGVSRERKGKFLELGPLTMEYRFPWVSIPISTLCASFVIDAHMSMHQTVVHQTPLLRFVVDNNKSCHKLTQHVTVICWFVVGLRFGPDTDSL